MNHTLHVTATYPTGAEQLDCEDCHYSVLVQWPPRYRKIDLCEGDTSVRHAALRGTLGATLAAGRAEVAPQA